MRLLKIQIKNVPLFENDLIIDFVNSDLVRKSLSDNDNVLKIYKIKSGIYTQVLLGITGLNATGKTTALELLSAIAQILFHGKGLNESSIKSVIMKVFPGKEGKLLEWNLYFLNDKKIYLLNSTITFKNLLNEDDEFTSGIHLKYMSESLLWKSLRDTKKEDLFDFINIIENNKLLRDEEEKNPYLKDDVSIVSSIRGIKGFIRPVGQDVNFNFPAWLGTPSEEAVHVFDPNISSLMITKDENGKLTSELSFRTRENIKYGGSPVSLTNLLSAGTIKGLSILPGAVKALRLGGYVFIDEIENHFNKKIIEWFLDLFTDKRTNPYGACLVFSTHYPELLDYFTRKDNIYITRRDENNYCECIRYSDYIKRNELSKSKIILENVIGGTAPRFKDLEKGKKWVQTIVTKGERL